MSDNDQDRFCDEKVVEGLYRRATGYEADGSEVVMEEGGKKRIKKVRRPVPPDVQAAIFWLKNRLPHQWRAKPAVHRADEIIAHIRPVRRLLP
jgi:hypothetical protein